MRSSFIGLASTLVFGVPQAGATPILDRPAEVGSAFTRCWHAPHEGDEITLRMSFRADGSIFGKPRITFMKASGGADGEADLATSAYSAIAGCSPLRFTPSLGAAIAGRTFLIRFVAPHREQRAGL